VALILAVPLMVTLGVVRSPHYYPLLDLAQTEMRVRDVTSAHPPLIGLPGRIGSFPNQGSHPGPISFYALAVFYNILGPSAWALQAATACLHIVAILVALWIAKRRGGTPLVLAIGAALAVLTASYGGAMLTEGWNPYLPVIWWFTFLLATWSVWCDDLPMLPIAMVTGTFCMQTHLPYLALAGGLLVATFVYVAVTQWRAPTRASALRWAGLAVGLGVLMWLPPIIEQFTNHPGNLSEIFKELRHPQQGFVSLHDRVSLVFVHLNPWRLITNRGLIPANRPVLGSVVPGALFLVIWGIAAAVAWRRHERSVTRLNIVLAIALVLGFISMVKIEGTLWYYLVLWQWGTTLLMLVAIGGAVVSLVREHVTPRGRTVAMGALVGVILVSTAFFIDEAAYTKIPNPPVNASLDALVPQTLASLRPTVDTSSKPRYLVTWDDPMTVGARGYALLNELERDGFDVGTTAANRVGVRSHRVLDPKAATAEIHLVAGNAINAWAQRPGTTRIAYVDPRDAAQRTESNRLRADAERRLRAAGFKDLADAVAGDNFLAVAYDPRTPKTVLDEVTRLEVLGVPVAVFVGPPS
jgi:hypothetical protein